MKSGASLPSRSRNNKTGSPSSGEPVFLAVGRLRRTHGIAGEMVMEILTDFPERLRPHKEVFLGAQHKPIKIASVRPNGNSLLIRFEGYHTPEEAAALRTQMIYIRAESLPTLPEGRYYYHELLGITVKNAEGEVLGTLTEIVETGANDVYVVTQEKRELLIPAIESVVLEVNIAERWMRVQPPEW